MTEHDLKTELRWMAQGIPDMRAAQRALERIEALEAELALLRQAYSDNSVDLRLRLARALRKVKAQRNQLRGVQAALHRAITVNWKRTGDGA